MASDDSFRQRLQHVISALESWAKEMQPYADIEYGPINGAWHIHAVPHAETACPFEIILRPDRKFDLVVGGQTFEDQPLDVLTDIPQMVRAISNGRVLIRHWTSSSTGLEYKVEASIDIPGSDEGDFVRENPDAPSNEETELIAFVEGFAPYRRG